MTPQRRGEIVLFTYGRTNYHIGDINTGRRMLDECLEEIDALRREVNDHRDLMVVLRHERFEAAEAREVAEDNLRIANERLVNSELSLNEAWKAQDAADDKHLEALARAAAFGWKLGYDRANEEEARRSKTRRVKL